MCTHTLVTQRNAQHNFHPSLSAPMGKWAVRNMVLQNWWRDYTWTSDADRREEDKWTVSPEIPLTLSAFSLYSHLNHIIVTHAHQLFSFSSLDYKLWQCFKYWSRDHSLSITFISKWQQLLVCLRPHEGRAPCPKRWQSTLRLTLWKKIHVLNVI